MLRERTQLTLLLRGNRHVFKRGTGKVREFFHQAEIQWVGVVILST